MSISSVPYMMFFFKRIMFALDLFPPPPGQVTTPQLHFMVHAKNSQKAHDKSPTSDLLSLYFDTLVGAYESLVEGLPPPPDGSTLHVDCANGVGARHLERIVERLRSTGLTLKLHNKGDGDGRLNDGCGADFVQKERTVPSGAAFHGLEAGSRCCSFDGDADRLVYFTPQQQHLGSAGPVIELLDGDKIATLAASYIRDLLDRLPNDVSHGVKVGAWGKTFIKHCT